MEISISDLDVNCLVDTGSSRTIISRDISHQISLKNKRLATIDVSLLSLRLADGTPLDCSAGIIVPVRIGKVVVKQTVLVANISDQAILGLDFMRSHGCLIDLSTQEFEVQGQRVPCSMSKEENNRGEVRLDQNYEIQPRCQTILWSKADQRFPSSCLIEANPDFETRYSIKVATCLATESNGKVPIRLMNIGSSPVKLYKNTIVSFAEPLPSDQVTFLETEAACQANHEVVNHIEIQSDVSIDHPTQEVDIPEYLMDLYKQATEGLRLDQKQEVAYLLKEMRTVFAANPNDLGRTTVAEHEIHTGDAAPIKQRPRRTPISFKGEEEKEIKSMLEKGVIRESSSPWSSPVVLVRKKDGTTRFCVDYRRLNEVTRKDSYPLPRMEDCFDTLTGSKFFSTMDLASGYWQIKMKDADRAKTAFVTRSGLYEFLVMPFGLVGAPSTFERCMETVLRQLQWQTCLVYLDDVIVFSSDFQEHVHRLREVLLRIKSAGLKLKPAKCHFFRKQVAFLGHVVSEDGIATDPEKIQAVVSWPPPTNVTQVRAYLGFCSYYRRFIPNFSQIAHPLSRLTGKQVPFHWTKECNDAFEKLKGQLISAPIMAYPTDTGEYLLDTDASDVAIGAVLSQTQGGKLCTIAYASRSLNKAERKYCVTRKELLAIVNFI